MATIIRLRPRRCGCYVTLADESRAALALCSGHAPYRQGYAEAVKDADCVVRLRRSARVGFFLPAVRGYPKRDTPSHRV